jgi:hypothetical protein
MLAGMAIPKGLAPPAAGIMCEKAAKGLFMGVSEKLWWLGYDESPMGIVRADLV